MKNIDKLRGAFDLVLSARLVHTAIDLMKSKAHAAADPHVALSTLGNHPTIGNCVDLVTEVAMVDAAAALSKESLEKIEEHARRIAKILARLEVISAMGCSTAPSEMMEGLEEAFQESTIHYEEMRHIRDITEQRIDSLVSQL